MYEQDRTFRTSGAFVVGSPDRVNVYNSSLLQTGRVVPDDPVFSYKSGEVDMNKSWQMFSEAVGDEWNVRYRGPDNGDQNLHCNGYDILKAGEKGRDGLYRVTGRDGQVGGGSCLQIKFWFDENGTLQMDWDALGDNDGQSDVVTANAFKVYAYLKDQCVAIARAYDPQRPQLALPWTNKLWDSAAKSSSEKVINSEFNYGTGPFGIAQSEGLQHPVRTTEAINLARRPYGAARAVAPPAEEKWYSSFNPFLAEERTAVVTPKFSTALDDNRRAGLPFSTAHLNTIKSTLSLFPN
jgi:hypothetical protein